MGEVESRFRAKCEQIGDVPCYRKGRSPGNQQRRFHGTKMKCRFSGTPCTDRRCRMCQILRSGFNIEFLSEGSGNDGWFGSGHYTTSKSSTAFGYAKGKMALLLVGVAAGIPDIVTSHTTFHAGHASALEARNSHVEVASQ